VFTFYDNGQTAIFRCDLRTFVKPDGFAASGEGFRQAVTLPYVG
jgi:hypothetical protein